MNFWDITYGIRAQGSNTRPKSGSTCISRITDLKTCLLIFTFLMNNTIEIFSELTEVWKYWKNMWMRISPILN